MTSIDILSLRLSNLTKEYLTQNEGLSLNSNPELSDSKLCAPVSTTHTPGIKKNICPKEVYNQIGKISYIDTKNITNIARCQRNGLDT